MGQEVRDSRAYRLSPSLLAEGLPLLKAAGCCSSENTCRATAVASSSCAMSSLGVSVGVPGGVEKGWWCCGGSFGVVVGVAGWFVGEYVVVRQKGCWCCDGCLGVVEGMRWGGVGYWRVCRGEEVGVLVL